MGFEGAPQKISKETSKKVENRLGRLKEEGLNNFEFDETPDEFIIHLPDTDERCYILKRKDLPVKFGEVDQQVAIEDIVEAKIRWPDKSISEAITKLRELKNNQE